tara:strand:+ start:2439 stop:2849 length:411 start_codon:yes stop_codon:yes gene_type:complete
MNFPPGTEICQKAAWKPAPVPYLPAEYADTITEPASEIHSCPSYTFYLYGYQPGWTAWKTENGEGYYKIGVGLLDDGILTRPETHKIYFLGAEQNRAGEEEEKKDNNFQIPTSSSPPNLTIAALLFLTAWALSEKR